MLKQEGEKINLRIKSYLNEARMVNVADVVAGRKNYALHLKKFPKRFKAYEMRDFVLRAGAKGATILECKNNRLVLYGVENYDRFASGLRRLREQFTTCCSRESRMAIRLKTMASYATTQLAPLRTYV